MKHLFLALVIVATTCYGQQMPITTKAEQRPMKTTGAAIIMLTSVVGGYLATKDPSDPTRSPGLVVIFGGFAIGTTVYFGRPDKPPIRH